MSTKAERERETKFPLQEAGLELECLACGQTGQSCANMDPGIECLSLAYLEVTTQSMESISAAH